jgi:hypothetical protein
VIWSFEKNMKCLVILLLAACALALNTPSTTTSPPTGKPVPPCDQACLDAWNLCLETVPAELCYRTGNRCLSKCPGPNQPATTAPPPTGKPVPPCDQACLDAWNSCLEITPAELCYRTGNRCLSKCPGPNQPATTAPPSTGKPVSQCDQACLDAWNSCLEITPAELCYRTGNRCLSKCPRV